MGLRCFFWLHEEEISTLSQKDVDREEHYRCHERHGITEKQIKINKTMKTNNVEVQLSTPDKKKSRLIVLRFLCPCFFIWMYNEINCYGFFFISNFVANYTKTIIHLGLDAYWWL